MKAAEGVTMEDSYTIMRIFAGTGGLIFLFLAFIGMILFIFRPGSRKVHQDSANIPFRHDDKPARSNETDDSDAHMREARQ